MKAILFTITLFSIIITNKINAQATYKYEDANSVIYKLHFQEERGTWTIQIYDSKSNTWTYAVILQSYADKGRFEFKDGLGNIYNATTYDNGQCILKPKNGGEIVYWLENTSNTPSVKPFDDNQAKTYKYIATNGVIYKLHFQQEKGTWTIQIYDSNSNQWSFASVLVSSPKSGYFSFKDAIGNKYTFNASNNGKALLVPDDKSSEIVYWLETK